VLAESLSRPPAINAGQRVRIVARGAGFSVTQEGNALNTAAVGEPVRAKLRSGRIVHGVAQDDGSVLVQP
jgi:flagella basal body P-ring formation protein FlgA